MMSDNLTMASLILEPVRLVSLALSGAGSEPILDETGNAILDEKGNEIDGS